MHLSFRSLIFADVENIILQLTTKWTGSEAYGAPLIVYISKGFT